MIWLYNGDLKKLSPLVIQHVEKSDIFISPFVYLELSFLFEKRHVREDPSIMMQYMHGRGRCTLADDLSLSIINEAKNLAWTRDPFDRLLVAHAMLHKASLLTKDRFIRKHYSKALW